MKKYKIISLLLIILLLSMNLISFTFGKYTSVINKKVYLNIGSSSYLVVFHSNNGVDDQVNQTFNLGESQRLTINSFTSEGLSFAGWNTSADGTGTRYSDNELVTDLTSTPNDIVHLYAQWSEGVAIVNGEVCTSLQNAINKVPTTGVLTTVILLKDVQEELSVSAGKNIIFDFGTHTLTNTANNKPIIENAGTVTIMNGNIVSGAGAAGAINNRNKGILYVNGGRIINTGDRQAIYNDTGTVTISGDAYLENTGASRSALQNQGSSTAIVTGGTIISISTNAIQNSGSLVIGTKDSNPDSNILIRGAAYGVSTTTNFNYYDGVIYGKNKAISNNSKIIEKEISCLLATGSEVIDGITYDKVYLVKGVTVTFNPNGGTVSESTRVLLEGSTIGNLPSPSRVDYKFAGWYTDPIDGVKISNTTIIDNDVTYYAHWTPIYSDVAKIGDVTYNSIQDAVDDCQDNTATTITLLKNVSSATTIGSTKVITLDLNGKTISISGDKAVFTNNGDFTITNGTLTSTATQSVINQNIGNLYLDNVYISITGTKQAVFIRDGNVVLDGGTVLESTASGASTEGDGLTRATLHLLAAGSATIKNATIINTDTNAISNEGTLIIGEKDGVIDNTSITIVGKINGIESTGTVNFYDGIIKGISETVLGTIDEIENNSHIVSDTEVIDSDTYKRNYLELD